MWCVRVPTGAFVARRNGQVFVTGNSGFPKSLDISKAIDKAAGAKRESKGKIKGRGSNAGSGCLNWNNPDDKADRTMYDDTDPATPQAALWEGYGTALKPAFEPIILAMKPLDGTFAGNALKHGVAGINVDGGRIGTEDIPAKVQAVADAVDSEYQRGREGEPSANRRYAKSGATNIAATPGPRGGSVLGRWPANVILSHSPDCVCVGTRPDKGYTINRFKDGAKPFGDGAGHEYESEEVAGGEVEVYACVSGCPVRMLDEQSGKRPGMHSQQASDSGDKSMIGLGSNHGIGYDDVGCASRFFYTAKSSTAERNAGLSSSERNAHPTVKPIDLMRYLLTLVTMPAGTRILDPFMGSGSTLVAAKQLGIECVGIDSDPESCKTTAGRLSRRTKSGLNKRKKLRRKRGR